MIKINFQEPADDKLWKRWRNDCKLAEEAMNSIVANDGVPEITELYKRKSIKDRFYFSEDWLFHGKCAGCTPGVITRAP